MGQDLDNGDTAGNFIMEITNLYPDFKAIK